MRVSSIAFLFPLTTVMVDAQNEFSDGLEHGEFSDGLELREFSDGLELDEFSDLLLMTEELMSCLWAGIMYIISYLHKWDITGDKEFCISFSQSNELQVLTDVLMLFLGAGKQVTNHIT
jgi:hypothetical protein